MAKASRQIPADLADQLEEEICQVLVHPSRRQILRTLTAGDQKMSTIQLESFTGASCPLPCTSYHARRLEEVDLIAQVGSEATNGTLTHHYSSLIGGNALLLAVLKATEASDKKHLAPAAT